MKKTVLIFLIFFLLISQNTAAVSFDLHEALKDLDKREDLTFREKEKIRNSLRLKNYSESAVDGRIKQKEKEKVNIRDTSHI
jgi:hypothetical protein